MHQPRPLQFPASWLMCVPAVLLSVGAAAAQPVIPESSMVITESTTLAAGTFYLSAEDGAAITIVGDDIEVDFGGAVIVGSREVASPDLFTGTGIRVTGKRVVLRNVVARGYKVAVHAEGADGLQVVGGDLSYNYRQRLKSSIEREHLDDWMSYHQNEADEWLRYGAALYVRDADSIRVENLVVTGGQNGIMLTEVNNAVVENNEITFNSAIGIGLYRSSNNRIQFNKLDWNVRGYSHGVYNRGQDSAALLLYEQSNENIFGFNSATHSGDGLFLWAGQTTMDSGAGGCNDNVIVGNDFSYAPTNGIEVTFSRNIIRGNRIVGCWHGIWGGYSFDTEISGNTFVDNDEHIAIEHGQQIDIRNNTFEGGSLGVRAWERATQPADWGYARERDVTSRGYDIVDNVFAGVSVPITVTSTDSVAITDNLFVTSFDSLDLARSTRVMRRDNTGPQSAGYNHSSASTILPPDPRADRSYILVDEWGPVDFRSPVAWPRTDRRAPVQVFELLGPRGDWRLISSRGAASVSRESGSIPDTISVELEGTHVVDLALEFEFVGNAVVDRFGKKTHAGQPFRFTYAYSFVPLSWDVSFFEYDDTTDPRSAYDGFRELLKQQPLFRDAVDALSISAYRNPAPGVPADHYATVATSTFSVPGGEYTFVITSDDGVRVWLDGDVIHDDWTYHAPRTQEISLPLGGQHTIRVEHFEIDGYSTLSLEVRR